MLPEYTIELKTLMTDFYTIYEFVLAAKTYWKTWLLLGFLVHVSGNKHWHA